MRTLPAIKAEFVESPAFERYRAEYLDDDGFRALQVALMSDALAGDVIEGSGGLRKSRSADRRRGKGRIGREEIGIKRVAKDKPVRAAKRGLFAEIKEGLTALARARTGQRTLRTHAPEFKPAPELTPVHLVSIREKPKLSRPMFAVYLRTNLRTLENWAQGRAKPNAQAALLINLVERYPDTIKRLASL